MESLNQPSNLQSLSRIQCNHNTDGTPCTGQKVVFGRRVVICLKKDGYSDGSRDGLRTVTQFLNGNNLKENTDSHFGLQPVGQGAFGTVTFIDSEQHSKICVLKTTKTGAPINDDAKLLEYAREKLEKHESGETDDLGANELNAFMLPEHENICKTYCALIKYDSEKNWTVITSKRYIDKNKKGYTVQALLLESCSGTELRKQLENRGKVATKPISPKIIYDIALKTAKGLNCIHKNGLIISDLKPDNILYNRETGELKIIDFGLSQVKPIFGKDSYWICGTRGFMAPEEYEQHRISTKGDSWSLGATLLSTLFDGDRPGPLMAEMLGIGSPRYKPDYQLIAEKFSKLDDGTKRHKINKKIKEKNGNPDNYSDLVDIIVGLTKIKRKRMSTNTAMTKLENLFTKGKVRYPGPLSQDAFNGIDEPFHAFSDDEIKESAEAVGVAQDAFNGIDEPFHTFSDDEIKESADAVGVAQDAFSGVEASETLPKEKFDESAKRVAPAASMGSGCSSGWVFAAFA